MYHVRLNLLKGQTNQISHWKHLSRAIFSLHNSSYFWSVNVLSFESLDPCCNVKIQENPIFDQKQILFPTQTTFDQLMFLLLNQSLRTPKLADSWKKQNRQTNVFSLNQDHLISLRARSELRDWLTRLGSEGPSRFTALYAGLSNIMKQFLWTLQTIWCEVQVDVKRR